MKLVNIIKHKNLPLVSEKKFATFLKMKIKLKTLSLAIEKRLANLDANKDKS